MRRRSLRLTCALAALAIVAALTPAGGTAAERSRMDWSVISRFGGDADGDGRLDGQRPSWPASPAVFPVLVRPGETFCAAGASASWSVDDRPTREVEVQGGAGCRVLVAVRGEGAHTIRATAGGRTEVAAVTVDDRLVVGLGDSVASGEGNPVGDGLWLDPPCHRSQVAGFEQAARLLAEALTRRSITFFNLACSGAEIGEGLLGPYAGVAPDRRVGTYRPQVDRLRSIAQRRSGGRVEAGAVDAVLLSVGANDVRFSQIVAACAAPGDCRDGRRDQVFRDLNRLDHAYDSLAGPLATSSGGAPVLITEYFDPTHDERGEFCRSSVAFTSRSEARWAFEGLLRPLNTAVSAAAVRNGWRFVGGIAADFERHGYCADPVERWVRRLGRSLIEQRDHLGTLHPSAPGHVAIAQRVAAPLAGVLGLRPPPAGPPPPESGRSTLEWVGLIAGLVFLVGLLGLQAALWPFVLVGLGLMLVGLVIWFPLWVCLRFGRLLRPTWRPDPCPEEPAPPTLSEVGRPRTWQQLVLLFGGAALLVGLSVVFAGVVGSAILWLRFWSARLPADQSVDAVSRSELVATGTQVLGAFVVLGLIAVAVAWLLDAKGQWVRSTRRGLVAIGLVEVFAATLIGDFEGLDGLYLFAGLLVAALLLHFLVDRALAHRASYRANRPLGQSLLEMWRRFRGRHLGRATPREWALRVWRAVPLLFLLVAMVGSLYADGPDRMIWVVAPLVLAAILFVAPGGSAARGTAGPRPHPIELESLEPARIALAVAGIFCIAALTTRDEAWLAASAAVAALLGLFCLTVAAASKQRFAPYGLAVLISVPLFGAFAALVRGVDSPELQPVAAILESGEPVCGVYIGESDGRLWVGRLVLDERGDVNRPRRGTIVSYDSERIAERVLGPLEPVARAQSRAVELRDDLLDARGMELEGRSPTCLAPEPVVEAETSWQRRLADRYQPELIIDTRDRFWPVPVRTLFAMQDRRAAICRRVAGSCLRLSTQGGFPWAGGEGESLEYPAADADRGEQHDLMVEALGSADPARTAAEYFLVDREQDGGDTPISIQYWFFYTFNYQPLRGKILEGGYHEGDFESVGVLLSAKTLRPRYIWMNRHDEEGRVFPWSDGAVEKLDDHPAVFVARGSHASYEGCATQIRWVAHYHLVDDHPTCDPDRQLHLGPESTPLTDLSRVAWGCWRGHFGHKGTGLGYEQIPYLVADAPISPLWQQQFDETTYEPCRGIDDPGDRDGAGEEVVEEADGVPARLREGSGSLVPLVDECADWETPPTAGPYLVACDQRALTAYVESGLEEPGPGGVRIDVADEERPELGEVTLPAVRRDPDGVYLDSWRITAAAATRVSVYASCLQEGRTVGARFPSVRVFPLHPLRLLDRGPAGGWRLAREDGRVVARADPFFIRQIGGRQVEVTPAPGGGGPVLACGGG